MIRIYVDAQYKAQMEDVRGIIYAALAGEGYEVLDGRHYAGNPFMPPKGQVTIQDGPLAGLDGWHKTEPA